MAACCAANGVPLRDPRKPSEPELFHERTLPLGSEIVTIVLLKEAFTVTTPCGTCLRSFFLNFLVLPFFSAPAAPAFSLAISTSGAKAPLNLLSYGTAEAVPLYEPCHTPQGLCLGGGLLLVRDRALAWSFTGTRVGVRTLSADRQAAAMTEAAVRTDFDEPLDMHR